MDDKAALFLGKKGCRFRRIMDGERREECDYDCEKSFEYENPAPSGVSSDAIHFLFHH
jgi:hypothetical protein